MLDEEVFMSENRTTWISMPTGLFLREYWRYLCEHVQMLVWLSLTAIMVYGARLFNGAIGTDTEVMMSSGGTTPFFIQIGRYCLVWMQQLTGIGNVNLYAANFASIVLLVMAAMAWNYWWSLLSKGRLHPVALTLFGIYFVSSGVWQEALYFTFQAGETSFLLLLMPLILYFLYRSFLTSTRWQMIVGALLLLFTTSTYQASVMYFVGGVLASFILLAFMDPERLPVGAKAQMLFLLKCFAVIGVAVAVWSVLKTVVMAVYGLAPSTYLTEMAGTHDKGLLHGLLKSGAYAVMLIMGNCSSVVDPVLYRFAKHGAEAVQGYHGNFYGVASIGYLPILLAYVVTVYQSELSAVQKLVAWLTPLCIFVFPVAGGGDAPLRAQWTIPLLLGFVFLMVLHKMRGVWKNLFTAIVVLTCFYQVQHVAGENYAALRMYEYDCAVVEHTTTEMYKALAGEDASSVKVLLYGAPKPDFNGLFVPETMSQHSIFYWDHRTKLEGTERGLHFFQSKGYDWNPVKVDDPELDELRNKAAEQPSYPYPGYVQRYGDTIVVKYSESNYQPKPES